MSRRRKRSQLERLQFEGRPRAVRTVARLQCEALKETRATICQLLSFCQQVGSAAHLIHGADHEGARLVILERLDRQFDRPEAPAEALVAVGQVERAVDRVRVGERAVKVLRAASRVSCRCRDDCQVGKDDALGDISEHPVLAVQRDLDSANTTPTSGISISSYFISRAGEGNVEQFIVRGLNDGRLKSEREDEVSSTS